jgi:hypothetical protein
MKTVVGGIFVTSLLVGSLVVCYVRQIRLMQCCESRMFIPDPTFFPSRIRIVSIPDPGSASKNLRILSQKKLFLSSRKYDSGCSFRIRILTFYPSRIQGSKRHQIPDPDPQHWINDRLPAAATRQWR